MEEIKQQAESFVWWVIGGLGTLWTLLTGIVTWLFQKYIKQIENNTDRLDDHDKQLSTLTGRQDRNDERDEEFRSMMRTALSNQDKLYKELKSGQDATNNALTNFLKDYSFILEKIKKQELEKE